jgi:hypothetical protein
LSGVPVNKMRCTVLSVFNCLKIFEESDLTSLLAKCTVQRKPTSLPFIDDQHLPSRNAFEYLEVLTSDHVVGGQNDVAMERSGITRDKHLRFQLRSLALQAFVIQLVLQDDLSR